MYKYFNTDYNHTVYNCLLLFKLVYYSHIKMEDIEFLSKCESLEGTQKIYYNKVWIRNDSQLQDILQIESWNVLHWEYRIFQLII